MAIIFIVANIIIIQYNTTQYFLGSEFIALHHGLIIMQYYKKNALIIKNYQIWSDAAEKNLQSLLATIGLM